MQISVEDRHKFLASNQVTGSLLADRKGMQGRADTKTFSRCVRFLRDT